MTSQGFANVTKLNKAGDTATGTIVFDGTPPVQIPAGAATGDVLTSDGSGNATWQVPAAAAAITTETARATAAEGVNAAAITAETSRATTAEALKAPLVSPALTGTPTAPTQAPGDTSTKVATDAFVGAAVTAAAPSYAPAAGVAGVFSVGGKLTLNGGTTTAGSAPVLTPTFSSTVAAQLTDTSRDYVCYLQFGAAGTAMSVAIGPTSTPANTIINSAAVVAGECINFRIPAGWYTKVSFTTTTLVSQKAIGC